MKKRISSVQNVVKKLSMPIQQFFAAAELSGMLLLAVTIIAMTLANSAVGEDFLNFWHTEFEFHVGGFKMVMDLHILINDVLMTLFFVMVGGEIKREMQEGALSSREKAILPIVAAFGGMLFPALIFLVFNYNQPTASGWGIPTATDIAFSLTIISLLGKKVPFSLKIFLLALAIADDLGAIVIIAFFYSNTLDFYYLFGGFAVIGILVMLNKTDVTNLLVYSLFGIILWYFFYMAGIHPAIAGVVLAFAIPFRLSDWENVFHEKMITVRECFHALENPKNTDKLVRGELIEKMQIASTEMESPLHNALIAIHPISSYVIMPLFAIANAGVMINTDALSNIFSPVSLGILCGLMLGKSTGIWLTTWLAVKLKWAQIPDDLNMKYIYGMAWVAGIGFTMSMFVTGLAFKSIPNSDSYIETAKIAILLASTLSGLIGYVILSLVDKVAKKK
ncbi:MAG: Na+/H+ antiporter NhaA [Cytophagales bacterium]